MSIPAGEGSSVMPVLPAGWSVVGPVVELVPPVQTNPFIGGAYGRPVFKVFNAAGVLLACQYGEHDARSAALVRAGL